MLQNEQNLTLPATPLPVAPPVRGRQQLNWLAPRSLDRIFLFVYLGTLFLLVYAWIIPHHVTPFPWFNLGGVMAAILGLIGIDRWEYWRYGTVGAPMRLAILLLALRVGLIELVQLFDDSVFLVTGLLYLNLPFTAALAFGINGGKVVAGLTWAWILVRFTLIYPNWYLNPDMVDKIIIFSIVILFVTTMANVMRRETESRTRAEQLLADLEISHQQLTEYAQQVADLAIVAERNRLARDIHDSLGHYLTVINVQLEKALVFRDKKPAEAEQAVIDSRRLAREALDDVRRSVGLLRNQKRFSLRQALNELVEPLQSSHLTIDLTIDGNEENFSPQTLLVMYRAAQEGLTNIQRHAHAQHAMLAVEFGADMAHLGLADDGIGFRVDTLDPSCQSGYGLQGVRERLELVGGTLRIDSTPGAGTRIDLTLPRELHPRTSRVPVYQHESVTL